MNAPGPSFVGYVCRALSPALLVSIAAAALLAVAIATVARTRSEANRVDRAVDVARTLIAADTALLGMVGELPERPIDCEVADVRMSFRRVHDELRVEVLGPDDAARRHLFANVLDGSPPRALARRRAALDHEALAAIGGGLLETASRWPVWDPAALSSAPTARESHGFARDVGVGLRYVAGGTDRDDFVWRDPSAVAVPPPGGLLIVRGHLWVLPGDAPLRVRLTRDLVVVVEGNIYLGRTLEVTGPGRLLLASRLSDGATAFADLDASGSWSPGDLLLGGREPADPIEGAGAVWLGLPGHARELRCDAGLVVAGQLHLAARTATVRGPLCVTCGVTAFDGAELSASHDGWNFDGGRDRVPGFQVEGGPRAGWLEIRQQ